MPEKLTAMVGDEQPRPTMSVGIKTITHNRCGLRIHPHKVIALEMTEGADVASFDLNPRMARTWARRLMEYADVLEYENVEVRIIGQKAS